MPEISRFYGRFYGIIIVMFFDNHNPPYFHARYGKEKVAKENRDMIKDIIFASYKGESAHSKVF